MTASHLNSSQLRVQALTQDLKNLDVFHLETHIDGLGNPEPPDYRKVDGKVQPDLVNATIKESAKTYDFGNVLLTEDETTSRIVLHMHAGEVDAHQEEPYPKDPANPLSVPVFDAVLVDLIPFWKAKYEAIERRLSSINQARAVAHNAPNQPERKFSYTENAAKLMHTHDGSSDGNNSPSRKRAPGGPVQKHPTNKRKRIGLESIPDTVKSMTFATIPDHFKVEMFNTIARAAFPNFDSLVMAAWNVVSLYETVGSVHTELHRGVVELRSVLLEFDAIYRKERVQARKHEKESQERSERIKSNDSVSSMDLTNGNNREARAEEFDIPERVDLQETPRNRQATADESMEDARMSSTTPAPYVPPNNNQLDNSPLFMRSSLPPNSTEPISVNVTGPPTPPHTAPPTQTQYQHMTAPRTSSSNQADPITPNGQATPHRPSPGSSSLQAAQAMLAARNLEIERLQAQISADAMSPGLEQEQYLSSNGNGNDTGHSNTHSPKPSTEREQISRYRRPGMHERSPNMHPSQNGNLGRSAYAAAIANAHGAHGANGNQHGPSRQIQIGASHPHLGNSKLGRAKGQSASNGMAPEAPMGHNGVQTFKKEANGNGYH